MVSMSKTLALGAGCYWGTEKYVVGDFQKRFPGSIARASVGFMSPDVDAKPNPSYEEVGTGTTGHVEVLNVEMANPEADLEELIRFFFMFHDPTTHNRQGNDVGPQYASVIFCSDDRQMAIANRVKEELQRALDAKQIKTFSRTTVETKIEHYTHFYPAHEEHQRYLEKNPNGYCNHRYRFQEWPTSELANEL